MGGAEARPSNLALNPARIVPRQEAVDSSNNLYRPTNLMAPCAPVPDAQIGQAPRVTRSWLEAELLLRNQEFRPRLVIPCEG